MPIINFQKVNDEFEYCELPYNLYIVKFNRKMFEKFSIARSSDTLVLSGILIQAIFDKKVHISRIFDNNFPLWDFKFNCYSLNDTGENDPCTIDINYPFKWCFIQNNFLPNGKVKNSTFSMKQLTKLYWLGRLDATDYYQDIINHMYSTKSLIALNQLSYKNMNFGNYKLNL